MAVSPEIRARLAREQAAIVAAVAAGATVAVSTAASGGCGLVAQEPVELPAGISAERLAATRMALAHKRFRALLDAWPEMETWLGSTTRARFDRFTAAVSLAGEGGAVLDGFAFVEWLLRTDKALPPLSDRLRWRATWVDLHWRPSPAGWKPRRGLRLRGVRLAEARETMLVWAWGQTVGTWVLWRGRRK